MSVSVGGQGEVEAALRQVRNELRATFTKAKKEGAKVLLGGIQSAWPHRTGGMASRWRVYTTASDAGVRNDHPGAGVVEFATDYDRRTPSGGTTRVHMSAGGTPPRHAFPVRDRMADQVIGIAHDALCKALTAKGYFEESG